MKCAFVSIFIFGRDISTESLIWSIHNILKTYLYSVFGYAVSRFSIHQSCSRGNSSHNNHSFQIILFWLHHITCLIQLSKMKNDAFYIYTLNIFYKLASLCPIVSMFHDELQQSVYFSRDFTKLRLTSSVFLL